MAFGMTSTQLMQYLYYSNMVFLFLIFIARRQIKNMVMLLLLKKKGYGLIIELSKNKQVNEYVAKLYRGKAEIHDKLTLSNNKTYGISPEDIFINPDYNCSAVVVSEKLAKSINIEGKQSEVSPQLLDDLIIEAKSQGDQMSKREKMVIFALIGVTAIALILAGQHIYNLTTTINEGYNKINNVQASITTIKDNACVRVVPVNELNNTSGMVIV